MLKTFGFVLVWLAGACLAVAVAWTGVAIVDDEIINPAPAALGPETPAPVRPERPVPTTAIDNATNRPTTAASTIALVTITTPTTDEPATTSTLSPATTSSTAPAPSTSLPPPTTTTIQLAQVQNFNLVGGSTAISFLSSGVQVLWATPNPGFEVRIEPEPPGIKVEFRADHHDSRIDAWWSAGPQHVVREKPE